MQLYSIPSNFKLWLFGKQAVFNLHQFNDRDFNRSQVELLEAGFKPSVRNPLEKSQKEGGDEKPSLANPLILFGAEART